MELTEETAFVYTLYRVFTVSRRSESLGPEGRTSTKEDVAVVVTMSLGTEEE